MIKDLIRKIALREKYSSTTFVDYLKRRGVEIGEDCYIPDPSSTLIDLSAPWLITMGSNVNIAHGVVILTHDFGWAVLKKTGKLKGSVLGAQAPVKIGSNVFIGVNTIITKGVTIGDNVVIGANCVVSKDCESNSVYAGNPARKVMTLDEYADRRESSQLAEAKELALAYREKFRCEPEKELFSEYFMLFCTADEAAAVPKFRSQMNECENYDDTIAYMNSRKPMFDSYEEFLKYCYTDSE